MVNPNLFILSYHRQSVITSPLTLAFRHTIVGFQAEGPSIVLQTNFNMHNRVAMLAPFDGFIHHWSVHHGGYPNQQQGKWRWTFLRNGVAESVIEDVANPTQPFNPGPGQHEVDIFDKRVGFTDRPLFFEKGDLFAWAFGASKGIFVATIDGGASVSLSVFGEYFRV